jgi:phosphoribosylaminoimidazole-succinocarboxamide synthase
MGSVKDLVVLKAPSKEEPGRGRFIFSDRYSVFDWGEMPDHIDQKGAALCISAAYFFEKLEKAGLGTHYLGMVEEEEVKSLSEATQPVNILETKLYRVLEPRLTEKNTYDYSIYKEEKGNYLIPLEIIYRNTLSRGSSVFERLKKGKLTLEELSLDRIPEEGTDLKKPFLDVSTKLEASDRYLSWQEAQEVSQLPEGKIAEIKALTLRVNQIISKEVQKIGLKNEDGKLEFALDEKQNIVLVDVIGTLDECRFTYQGIPVSKEIARIYYRKSDWYWEIGKAKEKDRAHWKELVISWVYLAFANELTSKEWFGGTPPLTEVLQEIYNFIK